MNWMLAITLGVAALAAVARKRAPSECKIEPPPAATVWMLSIGARTLTPATRESKARRCISSASQIKSSVVRTSLEYCFNSAA